MLDKELFFEGMEELLKFFPNWNIDLSEEQNTRAWYNKFKHMSDGRFIKAVDEYIRNEQFNPTVAGILKYYLPEQKKTATQIEHEKMLQENGLM